MGSYVCTSSWAVPIPQKGNVHPEIGAQVPQPAQEIQRTCCEHLHTDLGAPGQPEMQKQIGGSYSACSLYRSVRIAFSEYLDW